MTPDQLARQQIDAMLLATGWAVQNCKAVHFSAGRDKGDHDCKKANPLPNLNQNMISSTISFDTLAATGGALVDLSSAYSFLSHYNKMFLRGETRDLPDHIWRLIREFTPAQRASNPEYGHFLMKALNQARQSHAEPLRFIEQLVVNEYLAIDELLVERYVSAHPHDTGFKELLDFPFIKLCHIPKEAREIAYWEIQASRKLLDPISWHDHFFDFPEKNAYDFVEGVGGFGIPTLANSSDTAHRAFYYLSLASQSGAPLVVTEWKQQCLQQFRQRLQKTIHDELTRHAMAGRDELLDAYRVESEVHLPPIQEQIVVQILETGRSPWEILCDLRSSPEAVAYRKLLRELTLGASGNLGDRETARQKVVEIKASIEQWRTRPGCGLSRFMNIQEFPRIGWLVKAFGLWESVRVPDALITKPNPAQVFMARWFDPAQK